MARAGAEILALSVDSPARNAALARRWNLPFVVASDPDGEQVLRPLELWNPDERGGIALPALLVVSPTGEEAHRQPSRDFADRVHDEDVMKELEAQGYAAIGKPQPWEPEVDPPDEDSEELKGAFSPKAFVPLMNGNYFGALALAQRLDHPPSRQETKRHAQMAKSFLDAWSERREQ